MTAARQLSVIRATLPATRLSTQVRRKKNKNVLISKELRQLFWEIFMFVFFFFFQERSRTDVIFVVLSLTDQPTSKLTLASTQERSHTSVRRVELVLYRY